MSVLETTLNLNVEITYHFSRGKPGGYDKTFGNFLPGDGNEIKVLSVMMARGRESLDIKNLLDAKWIEFIENEINEIEESGSD